ncbi:MAG: GGDEF domain-containing protein [Deltaproteobacteria bacterium]|nr:GGDEF domain-containing protein [Deltaproteobacteria bacterium]
MALFSSIGNPILWLTGGAMLTMTLRLLRRTFSAGKTAAKPGDRIVKEETPLPHGYQQLMKDAPIGFFRLSPQGTMLDVNPRLATMLGYDSPHELLTQVVKFVDDLAADRAQGTQLLQMLRNGGQPQPVETLFRRRDGSALPVRLHALPGQEKGNKPRIFEGMVEDIRHLKEREKEIWEMAFIDTLTGLPNRSLFLHHLRKALQEREKSCTEVALLYLDVHRFKDICNTVGLLHGDRVLVQLAKRLREVFPSPRQMVGRLQGDDFAVLSTGIRSGEMVNQITQLQNALESPFHIDDRDLFITCYLGVAIAPGHGQDGETLLRNAHLAMNVAKDKGMGKALIFSTGMDVEIREKKEMEFRLRQALRNEEFSLFYQPQVNLANRRITGVEALLRWKDPEQGFVSPECFIPVAEEFGLIRAIGEWVLRTACHHRRLWLQNGLPPLRFSVNLSGTQLKQPDLMEIVDNALAEADLAPHGLELELTESILMAPKELTMKTLMALKKRGIGLAIDDFGTGYSSLHYLKHFPIDRLKIDQSFVRDIVSEKDDAAIVDAIISMTRSLGLEVIAEGVETWEQLNYLRRQNCHEMQGFYFCRPLPFDEICSNFGNLRKQLFTSLKASAPPPASPSLFINDQNC